ncbi:prephenate-dependent tRNA uridine(34) hydroxylase TrhP [Caldithrix abyssi]
MKRPELLVPAGTFEKMQYAFAYGADAVYAGIPRFSLRARENDFTMEKIIQALEYAHARGKRVYLTMNIYPHNTKIPSFTDMLRQVAELRPDGLIMADPGMILVARENHPELPIHLSTQANTINWQAVRFWKQLGVKRIILSRELRLDEIEEIRQHVPDIELETFVHGAICIAYSGRCLLSNYFNHRDANQGTCTNACRWEYKVYSEPAELEEERDVLLPATDQHFYLEEAERPGQLMPVDEDEHGTYIMNAKDLSTIHILEKIVKAGLDSLKVEGRTKSVYYVSVITRAYRQALDFVLKGQAVPQAILQEVYAVANRGYVTGFLERNPLDKGQNYESGHSSNQSRLFCGIIRSWDERRGLATIAVRNRFEVNDELELITPQKTIRFTVKEIINADDEKVNVAHGGGKDVRLVLPEKPDAFALLRKVVKQQTAVLF